MKNREDLIYDLIFSENLDYNINISEYIEDIYKYDKFIEDIKNVLRKSKVSLIKEKIDLETDNVIWNLKVKK
jgi:dihydroneopterin aldolase